MLGSWGSKIIRIAYVGLLLICLVVGGVLVVRDNQSMVSGAPAAVAQVARAQALGKTSQGNQSGEDVVLPDTQSHDAGAIASDPVTQGSARVAPSPSVPTETNTADVKSVPIAQAVGQYTPAEEPVQVTQTEVTTTLYVNGSLKGAVVLAAGSNHCDVLLEAYESGVISSLNMKYYSGLKSYGVYVIDGIGDSNSIWWTYTVNGKSLPYGCSHAMVLSGDSVEWKYVK